MRAGQDRPALRPAQRQSHRLGILDRQDGLARCEFLRPLGCQIFFRVLGVDLFHHHILIVQKCGCQPPTQPFRSADQHQRHPRNGAADYSAGGQLQPRQIPDRRRGQVQVRIICQQATARRCFFRRGRPCIRGAGKIARMKWRQRGVNIGHLGGRAGKLPRHQAGVVGQGSNTLAWIVGQNIGKSRGRQDQRHLRPQHLILHPRRQLHCHQLQDRDAVGRRPSRDLVGKKEEFWRATAACAQVHLGDPGVHPGRVGIQRQSCTFVLCCHRLLRQRVNVEPSDQFINLHRPRAENLGEPPLRGSPQHRHLP
ncbi:MAG: hypothetical protein ACD_54C00190G0002 [uncultured bacterium]|nr:MAG: hypothetical protein ACD_54C00190G0002 [uncultured bacterium]